MDIIILSIFKQTLTKEMDYELESKELTSCSQGGLAGRFGYIRRNRCEGIDKYQPHLNENMSIPAVLAQHVDCLLFTFAMHYDIDFSKIRG
ncbi:hypothetical protein SDC9_87874 [bioreactor metagenome]|uniref:Uncharacterized protein n=1 Tax=bioreactor metagenome TaxID=1076179 RepID=A0A644ZUH1_9ZZZZ